jgi:peptidoglycan/xylan/chitin deacetylase (PgdA/CDA1 family)
MSARPIRRPSEIFRCQIIRHFLTIGRFVTTAEVLEIVEGRKPLTSRLFHVSLVDGLKNIITDALPILMKYQVPAAFFVPTAIIGASTEMASWTDLEKAAAHGFDIGSHTRTHACFSDISSSKAAMDDEICGSKLDLERNLGKCDYIVIGLATEGALVPIAVE